MTQAKYIALSSALHEVIMITNLLEEDNGQGFKIQQTTPKIVCKIFKDNRSCIKITMNHKTRVRMKHLSVHLHHFHSYVVNKQRIIKHINMKNQLAGIFTYPLPHTPFEYLCNQIMHWTHLS